MKIINDTKTTKQSLIGEFLGLQSKYLSSYCKSKSLKIQRSFLLPSNWWWEQDMKKRKGAQLKLEDLKYSITKQL